MKLFDSIRNLFRRGGAKVGLVTDLKNITDHPRIGVAQAEYDRIRLNLEYFKGRYPDVVYKNTYGKEQKRHYVGLNMAQLLARRLASILVNEQMTFTIAGNEAADEYVKGVFAESDFVRNFERYLESGLALGGLAMRPYVDEGKVNVAFIQAPVFFPLQANSNNVSEAAIANRSTTMDGQRVVYWTLLEFHSWDGDKYVIENELYRSTDRSVVGTRQSLSANPAYADLEPRVEMTGITKPLFVYMRPFGFNNRDITSPLGLSIYDNAHSTLTQINDTYDQFNWEIKMGQRRVMVPESLVQSIDENGNHVEFFDTDQNVFVAIDAPQDDAGITDLSTDIRADEYIQALNHFIKTLEMQTGLAPGTFSFDAAGGLKTATEVVSEDSMTYQTRNSHLNNVERALQELVIAVLALAGLNGLYKGAMPEIADIEFNFDDGVFTDKNAQLDYYMKRAAAGLISKRDAIMKLDDVPEETADAMIADIQRESQPALSSLDSNMYGDI